MILFHFIHCKRDLYGPHFNLYSVFLGVAAAIVSWLLFFGLGNVQRLFNLLYYVIWRLHSSTETTLLFELVQ